MSSKPLNIFLFAETGVSAIREGLKVCTVVSVIAFRTYNDLYLKRHCLSEAFLRTSCCLDDVVFGML
jgi:hypothetical protein